MKPRRNKELKVNKLHNFLFIYPLFSNSTQSCIILTQVIKLSYFIPTSAFPNPGEMLEISNAAIP